MRRAQNRNDLTRRAPINSSRAAVVAALTSARKRRTAKSEAQKAATAARPRVPTTREPPVAATWRDDLTETRRRIWQFWRVIWRCWIFAQPGSRLPALPCSFTLALSTPFHKWHSFKRHVGRSCCATTLKAVFLRAATPPDRARFEVEVENFVFGGDIPAAVLWPLAMHGPFFSKAAGPATP